MFLWWISAAILWLQYIYIYIYNIYYYFPWETFCTLTLALPEVWVQCPTWLFTELLDVALYQFVVRYFLNGFRMVPAVPDTTGVTFISTVHINCVFIVRSLYFKTFVASVLIACLSPVFATSINVHVSFPWSRILMFLLLSETIPSFFIYWLHNRDSFL